MERSSSTKKFAYYVFTTGIILSGVCAYLGMEGAVSAIFSSATIAATAIWANRKYQNAKLELNKTN